MTTRLPDRRPYAVGSKQKGEALVGGFDKYRGFVGDGYWQVMDMGQ